ncbi:calcium-binding protein [Actinoplanes sp. NPDC049265]|uniref:calcium-binding protein n=1 Tax=Actinoplanes sp. NPDC049265 TaxID=3363902 RepID=UPI003718A48A
MQTNLAPSRRRRGRMMRYAGVVVVAAIGPAALLAAPAYASGLVFKSGTDIVATLSTAQAHNATAAPSGSAAVVISAVGETLSAGTGCTQSGAAVICPLGSQDTITLNGGDLSDTLTKTVNARGKFNGGSGDDTLNAGPSPSGNTLSGGPGRDTLSGGAGGEFMDGGTGPDTFNGGPGPDIVTYQISGAGVTVTIDNAANDGTTGEGDNVRSDVETIYGSPFGDTVTGSSAQDIFLGFDGDDRLNGGPGPDILVGGAGKDTLRGEGGDDRLEANDNAGGDLADGDIGFDTCLTESTDTRSSCEA